MHKKTLTLTTLTTLLFSSVALADKPVWNFAEVGYIQADYEDIEPKGFAIKGSALVGEALILSAEYNRLSEEIFGADVDLNWARIGLGYRFAASDSTDIYGRISYENLEAEASYQGNSASEDENGYGLTIGVRSRLSSNFEIDGNIGYIDIADESETAIGVAANYYFTNNFAVGVNYTNIEDLDIIGASLRLAF